MIITHPQPNNIPPKVQAAQQFLYFAHNIKVGPQSPFGLPGDAPKDNGVELSKKEQAAYDAALHVMIQYFNGEQDFNPPPPDYTINKGDDNDPKQPVPV